MAELQEQAMTGGDQAAAADIAQCEIDLVAGTPAHILQLLPEGACGLLGDILAVLEGREPATTAAAY